MRLESENRESDPPEVPPMEVRQEAARRAGTCYRTIGKMEQAARCFERGAAWAEAAECHLADGHPGRAGSAFSLGGQTLWAAWVWADQGEQYGPAQRLIEALRPASTKEALMLDLIRARCEVGLSGGASAARIVRSCIRSVEGEEEVDFVFDWMLRISTLLSRFDLIADIFATRVRLRHEGALEQWRTWAQETLGDSSRIPDESWLGRE